MKKLIILIFIAALVVSGVFGSGYISKHMKQGFRMADNNMLRGQMLLRMKTELELTPDQVKKIEKMSFDFQESVIKRMADTKIMEIKLVNYLRGEKVNKKVIEKMIKEISMMKADMQIDRVFHFLDIKSILTPEQIKKAEELKKNFKRRAFFRQERSKNRKGTRGPNRPAVR